MESKNQYKEERFDSFLNKTIILSSKAYFKKQMNAINKENTIVEKCSVMLLNNPIPKLDAIIKIFEEYIKGANNE